MIAPMIAQMIGQMIAPPVVVWSWWATHFCSLALVDFHPQFARRREWPEKFPPKKSKLEKKLVAPHWFAQAVDMFRPMELAVAKKLAPPWK